MALRAVPEHPKFSALKSLLSLTKFQTLGLLEALWHFTGKFAPRGNIGKFTNKQIEAWLEWTGQEGLAVSALIDSGWIDASAEHRLLVHDWHEHADSTTRKQLGRLKKLGRPDSDFVSDMSRTSTGQVQDASGQDEKTGGPPAPGAGTAPDPAPAPGPARPALVTGESIAAEVMRFCGITNNFTAAAMAAAAKHEHEVTGDLGVVIRERMITAVMAYREAAPKLTHTIAYERLFNEGLWNKPDAWPWKEDRHGKSGNYQSGNQSRGAAAGRVERTLAASREAAARRKGTGSVPDSHGADVGLLPTPGIPLGDGGGLPIRHGAAGSEVRAGSGTGGVIRSPPSSGPEILPPSRAGS